ncbi:LysR family transcriptional regulator [Streptomyces hebeiensis]|uniref:LysR family transcriptional regulator n=1 Tax=Streptomyces hebeiensis TaxID=229486 RepID=UPI0031DCA37D
MPQEGLVYGGHNLNPPRSGRPASLVSAGQDPVVDRAETSSRPHVSQPPLTQRIQRLEEELGEKLVIRSTRRISLTPAGEALLPEARRVLQQYRCLPALVARSRSRSS